jgi:hypothetical protein
MYLKDHSLLASTGFDELARYLTSLLALIEVGETVLADVGVLSAIIGHFAAQLVHQMTTEKQRYGYICWHSQLENMRRLRWMEQAINILRHDCWRKSDPCPEHLPRSRTCLAQPQ